MSEWKIEKLRGKIKLQTGFPFKSSGYVTQGIKLLRGDNVVQGSLRWEEVKYWPASEISKYEGYQLEEGDVILAMDRPWIDAGLKYAVISTCDLPCLQVQRTARLRGTDKIDSTFLKYVIASPRFTKYVKSINTGSSVPHISGDQIRDFYLPLPPLNIQQSIADVLSPIDKKIELNNRINTELEAMAKLIYDYWFVQFDFPDANGKPYKSSGGKMVYSQELKREIPEGWEIRNLSDIEPNIVTGKTPPTAAPENFGGDVPFICIGDIRGNMHVTKTELTLSTKGANSQKGKYVPEGAICVTCIASPGLVGFASETSQTNQQLNTIICHNFEDRYFLYFHLKDYFRFAKAKAGNTFANMNKGDFSSIKVIYPRKEMLKQFSSVLEPSIKKVLFNSKEINQLADLRDWLLPMLMNGQVTVKDAEQESAKQPL